MEKTFRLIEFYEENACLYNTKEKQYHDRNLKSTVLVEQTGRYCFLPFWVKGDWQQMLLEKLLATLRNMLLSVTATVLQQQMLPSV